MSGSRRYVLDANVFIEAKKGYYGFELCPGFWTSLVVQHKNSRVFSIDRVLYELTGEGDQLSDWVKKKAPNTLFKQTQDQAVIEAFRKVLERVNSEPQFSQAAKNEFASAADGWLVAYAKVNGIIVVTHEVYAPGVKNRVPIPNICQEFNVDYVNTFGMLKDLEVKFVLRTKRQRRK